MPNRHLPDSCHEDAKAHGGYVVSVTRKLLTGRAFGAPAYALARAEAERMCTLDVAMLLLVSSYILWMTDARPADIETVMAEPISWAADASPAGEDWRDRLTLNSLDGLAMWLGGRGDDFTGDLLRLIARADRSQRYTLHRVFPREVLAWQTWMSLTEPTGRALRLMLEEIGTVGVIA